MGMQLSDNLRRLLELLGMDWPGTDEDRVAAWASDWRALAGGDSKVDLDLAVRSLAERNEGAGLNAFVTHIRQGDSAMARYNSLFDGCEALAKACIVVSQIVLALKIAVIGHLTVLGFSLLGAISSGGAGALGVAVAKGAAKRAIGMALEEAVNSLLAE